MVTFRPLLLARSLCFAASIAGSLVVGASPVFAQTIVVRSPEEGRGTEPPPPPSTPPPQDISCACGQELQRIDSGWVCGCPSGKHAIDEYLKNGDMRCIDPLPANWRARGAIMVSTRRQDAVGGVPLPAIPGLSVGQQGKVCADVLQRACGTTFEYVSERNTWRTIPEVNHPDFVPVAPGESRYAFRGHDGGGFNCARHDGVGGWYLPDTRGPVDHPVYNGCCDWVRPQCPFFTVQVEQGAGDGNKFEDIYQRANVPQCLKTLLQSYVNECSRDKQGGGDCTAKKILGPDFKATGNKKLMFMAWDANCNAKRLSNKAEWDAYPACQAGFFRTASPISLLFGKHTSDVSTGVLAQFPLNPGKVNMWYRWKASEEEPLIVYDPEHKGEITSAHQLFGEWTFGGQRQASLLLADGTFSSPIKWENGFQALATLDRDGDGALRGKELAALGLWFDRNRDGVSQHGEVEELRGAGVTSIFVTPNRTVTATKSIVADRGYERVVDGKIVTGAAVDWYGEEVSSPYQAFVSASFAPTRSSVEDPIPSTTVAAALAPQDSKVTGVWQWRSFDAASTGLLYLTEEEGGAVNGFSFVPARAYEEASGEAHSAGAAAIVPVKGSVLKTAANELTLELHSTAKGVGVTVTRATLSRDGLALQGTSDFRAEGVAGSPFSYSWTAERLLEGAAQ